MVSGMDHATGECAVRIGIDSLSMTQYMAPLTTLGTDLGLNLLENLPASRTSRTRLTTVGFTAAMSSTMVSYLAKLPVVRAAVLAHSEAEWIWG
jgi:hypothetical protein